MGCALSQVSVDYTGTFIASQEQPVCLPTLV
jgi:hypothetical protein